MSFEENKENVLNEADSQTTNLEQTTENTVENNDTTEKPDNQAPWYQKADTWIIAILFLVPAVFFAYKKYSNGSTDQAVAQKQNDATAKIIALEQKAAANPTYDNLLALGIAYENNGRAGQAIKVFNQALQLSPNNPVLYNNLGFAKIIVREYDEAIADLMKAIQLDSTSQLAKNNLKWALDEKVQLQKTIQKKEATPEKDRTAKFYIDLGLDYQAAKQHEKSLECWQKSAVLDPKNVLAYNNQGVAYISLKRYDEAIAVLNKAIEVDPSFQLPKNNLKWAKDEKAAHATAKK